MIPNPHVDHYPEISQGGWSLVSATTPQPGYEGEKAFDGDVSTYYHVPWGSAAPRPHEIVIDLGQFYTLNEFYYTANKNDLPPWEGRIQDYKIYISSDGITWGTEVAAGTFFQTGIRQYVLFTNTTGRYIRFSAFTSFPGGSGDVRTSIAEINLRGFDPATVVTDPNASDGFLVYPNPTTGQFTLQLMADKAEITVVNMLGEEILRRQTTQKTNSLQLESSGVYTVYVKTKQGIAAQKVIVER
jgi:hypothetical protein